MTKRRSILYLFTSFILISILIILSSCVQNTKEEIQFQGFDYNDNYQLEQMSIVSRHGVRSPIINPGSAISTGTPYQWFD
ncbi:MAG: hypothetical protein Q4E88_03705 [Coriobacteriia bacterium]|nr:hypothetical protein [Coriobacteriia bacterium]